MWKRQNTNICNLKFCCSAKWWWNQDFTEGETLAALEVTGTNLKWYATETAAENGTPELGLNEPLVDGATYYAVQTINGCSSNPLAVTVSMMLSNPEFDLKNLKVYPNPVTDILSISYSENIISVKFSLDRTKDNGQDNQYYFLCNHQLIWCRNTGAYLVRVSSEKHRNFQNLKEIIENNFKSLLIQQAFLCS